MVGVVITKGKLKGKPVENDILIVLFHIRQERGRVKDAC